MKTFILAALLAIAAMTVFAPAAEACISCEYVPEVVRSSSTAHEAQAYVRTPYVRKRSYTAERAPSARPAKRIVRSEPVAKKVETAKTAPIMPQTESENSTISTATLDTSENIAAKETPTEETKVNRKVDCKNYFASADMTLTVPCG